jgi:hypothetical protein
VQAVYAVRRRTHAMLRACACTTVLQYNSPWTLPTIRRNEVLIKLHALTWSAPDTSNGASRDGIGAVKGTGEEEAEGRGGEERQEMETEEEEEEEEEETEEEETEVEGTGGRS